MIASNLNWFLLTETPFSNIGICYEASRFREMLHFIDCENMRPASVMMTFAQLGGFCRIPYFICILCSSLINLHVFLECLNQKVNN